MKPAARLRCQLAALILTTTLASTAHAGLKIEDLFITANTLATTPDGQTYSSSSYWDMSLTEPVHVVSASIRSGGLAAGARQAPDGFFFDKVSLERGWEDPDGPRSTRASTTFKLSVSTDTPNTPLILDFHFFGGKVSAGATYATGTMTVGATSTISAAIQGTPYTDYWSFDDQLELNGSAVGLIRQSNGTDLQGIGLPQASGGTSWFQFELRGETKRSSFDGTLNFGLLQPGDTFKLTYEANTWIEADLPYAGDAHAELVDPFSLGGTPPLQLQLRGLTLPVAAVPEPASVLLMLLGLSLITFIAQRRRARR